MTERKPVVHVVDDDTAVRCSLQRVIRSVRLEVRTYAGAHEFLDDFDLTAPACLVIDVRLNGMSGLDVQDNLAKRGAGIPIIMISGHGDIPTAVRAMRAGALDFLEKPFSHQVLLDRIWQALELDAETRQKRRKQQELQRRITQLTLRQRQVLERIAVGQSTAEVANELGLSTKTVYAHRSEALAKMNSHSVAEVTRQLLIAGSANGNS